MTYALKQPLVWHWPLLPLVLHVMTLCGGSTSPGDCSGRFALEDSTVKLILQHYVNSTEDAVECRYTFEAPENSGLLFIANDIRAVNDGEIPGCPVSIYGNVEARGDPVFALCGHYATLTIPVPSSLALVVYKPEFLGSPYTLTLDLQVASTGGSNLRACGDSQLNSVSAVPVRYSLGFRADAGSGDASSFCDLNATSKDDTLGTKCVLTGDGVCDYEVLLSNGSTAEFVDFVDLAAVGGSATVRLHPASITGVLISNLPAGFVPLTSLQPPPTNAPPPPEATASTPAGELVSSSSGGTSNGETSTDGSDSIPASTGKPDGDDDVNGVIVDDCPPTLWNRMTNWFTEAWETVTNAVTSAFKSVGNWFRSWF